MQYGLFSNDRRPDRTIGEAWDLDIEEIVAADAAGMHEAWISEHQSIADLIVCRAAGVTTNIRLGSAVRVLPHYHPVQIVLDAASSDHLTHGRYMLGVGRGFGPPKQEWRGTDSTRNREMTEASLDVIQRLLRGERGFDFENEFWSGQEVALDIDFVQKPHPPIAMPCATTPTTAFTAGKRGIGLLVADLTSPERLQEFGDALEEGQAAAGLARDRSGIRACRVIYVGETDASAREDMRQSYTELIAWEIEHTPWHQYDRIPPGGTLQDITYDGLIDRGNLLIGSAETVTQMIERFFQESGGFGVLLMHAGRDYATHEKMKESIARFMRDVAPRVEHLDPAQSPEAALSRGPSRV